MNNKQVEENIISLNIEILKDYKELLNKIYCYKQKMDILKGLSDNEFLNNKFFKKAERLSIALAYVENPKDPKVIAELLKDLNEQTTNTKYPSLNRRV